MTDTFDFPWEVGDTDLVSLGIAERGGLVVIDVPESRREASKRALEAMGFKVSTRSAGG
jgi:hypothetical protein